MTTEGELTGVDKETRTWAMWLHLSQLSSFVVPIAGLVVPIVIWQVKKEELPGLDAHGRIVTNWILSSIIYTIICIILMFVLIGFVAIFALIIAGIIFPIIGAIKANDGETWKYPFSIPFL